MAHIEREGKRIYVHSEFREKELVQQVPGAKWDEERGLWWASLSWSACVQLRGTFGDSLSIGDDLTAWAMNEVTARVQPCMSLRDGPDANLDGFLNLPDGFELTPRQRAGVLFLQTAKRAALCDGMGSGKTVMLICALELMANLSEVSYPALIVCPNSMKYTWEAEFKRWASHRTVQVIAGGAAARRKQLAEPADVYIINWEGLKGHTRLAGYGYIRLSDAEKEPKELNHMGLQTVIADECHRAKNPQAKQTRALWHVAKDAPNRFAATGTPIANSPEDMWSIMHYVEPSEWPSKVQFITRYAMQSWNQFGGMSVVGVRGEMRDELFKILDPRFIRRPTEMVVEGMPPKMPSQYREVDLTGKQRKAYDSLRKELLAELENGILMASNPLTRMIRLSQLAAAYGELDEHGNMRLTEPSAKLDALDDILEELGDEPAVIFAESKQLIDLAAIRQEKAKIPFGLITGGVSPQDRQVAVNEFQEGNIRLILATMGAGAEGITLTASRFPIFLQRSFSLVKNKQAEDRTWRKGQTRPVQPIDIIARDTLELDIINTMFEKEGRLEEIARDQETLRKWLAK